MSSSRGFSDGRRQKQLPEKSNFAQTCNLLSQYMKEKGSLKNLNLEIDGKVESLDAIVNPAGSFHAASASTSVDLNTNIGKSVQASSEKDVSTVIIEDDSYKASTSKEKTETEHKKTQLTIFYSGRVLIFDDYPVEKVRELVSIAKKGGSRMSYGIYSNTVQDKTTNPIDSISGSREGLPPKPQASNDKQPVGISSNTCQHKIYPMASTTRAEKELSLQPETANGSDLPIARRSSLHRFLEKRKDRAAVRGPYQDQEQPGPSSKGDDHFDLNILP